MLVPMNDVNPYAAAAHIEVLPLTPTRQSIERTLVEWMTQTGRPAGDLSVSALCKKAFVARSTFYANYQHMGQVYESVENRLLRQLFECAVPMRVRADGTDETMRSFNAFVKVLHAHENEFRLVLVRQPSSRFVALWKQSLEYHVWHRLFEAERGGAATADAVAEWGDGAAPDVEWRFGNISGGIAGWDGCRCDEPERIAGAAGACDGEPSARARHGRDGVHRGRHVLAAHAAGGLVARDSRLGGETREQHRRNLVIVLYRSLE